MRSGDQIPEKARAAFSTAACPRSSGAVPTKASPWGFGQGRLLALPEAGALPAARCERAARQAPAARAAPPAGPRCADGNGRSWRGRPAGSSGRPPAASRGRRCRPGRGPGAPRRPAAQQEPPGRPSRRRPPQSPQKRNGRRRAAAPLRRRLASHPGPGAPRQDTRLPAAASRMRARSRAAAPRASAPRGQPFCGPRTG